MANGKKPRVRLVFYHSKMLTKVKETVEPDAELAARYEAKYQKFKKIYPSCKELFAQLNS